MINTLKNFYQSIQDALHNRIEAAAYAEDNKLSIQPQFFSVDLNTARVPGNVLTADRLLKTGRFNRIFMVDPDPEGVTAVVKIKLTDNQGREELLPLYAGAVLTADNDKVWTRVEFFNDSIDKIVLMGLGMNISYQQNLVSIANSRVAENDSYNNDPLSMNITIPADTLTMICENLVGIAQTRSDFIQNFSGQTIIVGYNTDLFDTYGIEMTDNNYACHESLVALYAISYDVPGYVQVISTRKMV